MLHIILAIVIVVGSMYFLISRRSVDFHLVAFFSTVFYVAPLLRPYLEFRGAIYPVYDLQVWLYILILSIVLVTAVASDRLLGGSADQAQERCSDKIHNARSPLRREEMLLFLVAFAVGSVFLVLGWREIFSPGKPSYGREHALLVAIVTPIAVYHFYNRRYKLFAILLVFPLLDVYGGNREMMVFVAASVFIVNFTNGKPLRLISHWRYLVFLVVITLSLLVWKGIYVAIGAGNYELAKERLADSDYYFEAVTNNESVSTQALLSVSISRTGTYEGTYGSNFIRHFAPFARALGFGEDRPSADLNLIFGGGMASNFLAEAMLVQGAILAHFYVLVYCILILVFNALSRRVQSIFLKSVIVVSGVMAVFFIHRSGLDYNLTLQSRLWGLSLLIYGVVLVVRGRNGSAGRMIVPYQKVRPLDP